MESIAPVVANPALCAVDPLAGQDALCADVLGNGVGVSVAMGGVPPPPPPQAVRANVAIATAQKSRYVRFTMLPSYPS
jgi:hypothetical protein